MDLVAKRIPLESVGRLAADGVAAHRAASIAIVLPAAERVLAAELEALSARFEVIEPSQPVPAGATHVYAPQSIDCMLDSNQLCNALLCLDHQSLDFLIVSTLLCDPPGIRIAGRMENLIASRVAYASLCSDGRLPVGSRGRVLKLLPGRSRWFVDVGHAGELDIGSIRYEGAELVVTSGSPSVRGRDGIVCDEPPLFARTSAEDVDRPTVFVLSIFMAVGGAEKNLIEVMKQLGRDYRFVVLTTESLDSERGSLNHQALAHCDLLFDLAELAPASAHLEMIAALRDALSPSLLFICNGSPWLLDNAAKLRDVFAGIPIVDQQVYDAQQGWVQSYGDPGIQSFDRFIAINQRIRDVFEGRLGMPRDRIDLIYHAVDDARFNLARADELRGSRSARVQSGTRTFGMVGRLTAQKRPALFLELARRAKLRGFDDRFVLIGDGELAAECDSTIRRHALDNVSRIRFCEDLSQVLPGWSGLVITSEYEGLPVSMLEALCMGVPVLSTDVGDVGRVLAEYGCGRIVAADSGGDELFDAFCEWRDELPSLSQNTRVAAPEVTDRFSAAAVASRYACCWESAIQTARSASDRGRPGC